MNKNIFLSSLRQNLAGLPRDEVEERLSFYEEMIADRIEEGLSEEEAVLAIGTVDEITVQILSDIPLTKIAKEKIKPKRKLRAWEIVLLAVGSPLWLSLLLAAFAVLISLYAVLWSLVASCWAIFGALGGVTIGGIGLGVLGICMGKLIPGLVVIGAAAVCAGLAIFAFIGCLAAVKGTVWLTKKIILGIKRIFVKKEVAA